MADYTAYKEAYELQLIDELANEKFSWSSLLKAFQLPRLQTLKVGVFLQNLPISRASGFIDMFSPSLFYTTHSR